MRRAAYLLLILLSAAGSALSQAAPDAAELTKLLNEFLAGAGRNDISVHERFWADDLIYTRSTGIRTTKDEILKGMRTAPQPDPSTPLTVYTSEDIVIRQYGTTAVVAFRLVSTTTNKDGTKKVGNNLNTGVFLKRKGIWQVVAWQSTIVPDPKTALQPSAASSSGTGSVDTTRTYLKGPRGGCYYLSSGGSKTYVDKKFCG